MPSTDAGADATATPVPSTDTGADTGLRTAESGTGSGTDCEDTLDLRLPDELIALFAEEGEGDQARSRGEDEGPPDVGSGSVFGTGTGTEADDDLLDRVADWGPVLTALGEFHLTPVHIDRDLSLITRWMNDPAVAEFWELAGSQTVTQDHLRAQLAGDGRSVPCLGVLEGTPMSYWEIYRTDLDPLARHYPARPHDTGIHLLIGSVADRGRGLGSTLLRAVADLVLDRRPACARVIAEPDLRNTPSVAAFLSAGFRFSAEVDLPAKRAALMVRDRSLRDLL
ncbi:GNAT family N-acetyltransferase [Streptomyces sp. CA-249302]|uniref:GNAT family N-acetyltransferase n=1 Tax=Streptomyces sp. CA-249302 TaxID=3240058 RepID=UPI003D904188